MSEDLSALRRRDPEALSRLVKDNSTVLLRGALALGLAETDAEEIVQDSFVAFLNGLERFEGRSSSRTFLFGILYRKALEHGRRRKREGAVEDVEAVFEARFNAAGHWMANAPAGPEQTALSSEVADLIRACAEGLSDDQRAAFFLKEAEGATGEEVCNILGVSGTHLRVLLFRARLKLRECLERSWGLRE